MVFVNKTRKHEVKIKVKKRGAGSTFCSPTYAINILFISFNQLFHAAKYNLTTMGGMRKRTDVLFTFSGDRSAVLSLQGLIRTLFLRVFWTYFQMFGVEIWSSLVYYGLSSWMLLLHLTGRVSSTILTLPVSPLFYHL